MLELVNISKSYKREKLFWVLKDVNLTISENEFVIIKGTSGSGKTTLLHVMSSLLSPDEGKVLLKDTDIYSLKEKQILELRRKSMSFLFQDPMLLKELTVFENIILPNPGIRLVPGMNDRISAYADQLELGPLLNHYPNGLSPGEMQRVAFCRCIVNSPEILFMDEPFSNLDKTNKYIMAEIIQEYWKKGATIVIVSHETDFLEKYSRIVNLESINKLN
ncbi:ATP-binding cassette domain-containing protein [bacterium]|nr:ATP-binding cassette domain-containing protein [bacterium]